MTPEQVIELFQDPKTLLRQCYLHIIGGATRSHGRADLPLPPVNGQADTATFDVEVVPMRDRLELQKVKGFTTGLSGLLGIKKDRWFVRITKRPGPATENPAGAEFNAYYIPMVQTSDVLAMTSHYTLPTGDGTLNIMITSKLSGCTFGVGSDGEGAVLVSHVQPNLQTPKDNRANELSNAVDAGFSTMAGVFKKGDAYTDKAAVIGHRTGTAWTFYLQAMDINHQANKDVISRLVII